MLAPGLAGVAVEDVSRIGGSVRIMARTTAPMATCPGCGTESRSPGTAVTSGGCEVMIYLAVRRFFCPAADCAKKTFAEQADGLTSRYARQTPAVTAMLEAVALALGGRAGAHLSGPVSGGREPDDADPADPRDARSRPRRVAASAGSG